MEDKIFLVKNLYGYEIVNSIPLNLPKNMITVYVTDSEETSELALSLGWDFAPVFKDYKHINDKFSRRKVIALINSYPHYFVPDNLKSIYKIFVCDSNIKSLWYNYNEFITTCPDDKPLYVTTGYYSGERDNILGEMYGHLNVKEWSYSHADIETNTKEYIRDLENLNIDWKSYSAVSAKYIGWNVKDPYYKILSNTLYKEYCKHLGGNIILTYMSILFSDNVYNYYTTDYNGFALTQHNFGG